MPNNTNVKRPITLIGNGRSGTSLVSNIIGSHPDCVYVGETANLIHSVYKSMVSSLPQSRYDEVPEVVRDNFIKLYPSAQKEWFHKPIGIPIVKSFWKNDDQFIEWYWKVIDRIFPGAIYFSVLRNPIDVIESSHKWWDRPYKSIIKSNHLLYKILTHEDSRVSFAFRYEDIINPDLSKDIVTDLLERIGLDYNEKSLSALGTKYVARGKNQRSDTYIDEIKELLTDNFYESFTAVEKKFGLSYNL